MSEPDETHWKDTQRLESWAGETRLNLIRLLAIAVFYGRHVIEALAAPVGSPVRGKYHAQVTFLCLLWASAAVVMHMRLTRRRMDPWLKYAATGFDAAMITGLCALAGGPKTPLVLLYFPLIAAAPMRLSLRLVYVATGCAIAGYLILLGHYAWYIVGFRKYYSTPELRIPRSQEAIWILAMLVCGFLAGQVVRQMHRITARYPVAAADSVRS
jgi:hypothetical protein